MEMWRTVASSATSATLSAISNRTQLLKLRTQEPRESERIAKRTDDESKTESDDDDDDDIWVPDSVINKPQKKQARPPKKAKKPPQVPITVKKKATTTSSKGAESRIAQKMNEGKRRPLRQLHKPRPKSERSSMRSKKYF